MGKIQDRLSILEVLAGATEPMRPSDIGDIVGFDSLKTSRILSEMEKSGLTHKPDKKT